jgi:hypothetical protein
MIDLQFERILSLKEAAATFPGGPVCYETVRRWASDGIRGIKLEAVRIGGRRKTTLEACQRFIERVTATDDPQPIFKARNERAAWAREQLRREFGI